MAGTTANPTILTPALLTTFAWIVDATGSFDRPSVTMITVLAQRGRSDDWKSDSACRRAAARLVDPPTKPMELQAAVVADAVEYCVRPNMICESVP